MNPGLVVRLASIEALIEMTDEEIDELAAALVQQEGDAEEAAFRVEKVFMRMTSLMEVLNKM